MVMLDELEVYYRQNGILATQFSCAHKANCSKGCESFTGPKSAFVSAGYENWILPRLLFLSLDAGYGDEVADNRLPDAVREQEQSRDVRALPKNRHWFRTHELAWYILKRFDRGLKLEQAKNYFAHANSAKCSMNNPHSKKAHPVLFANCQKYLKGELEILGPEIIVSQGNEAKQAVVKLHERCIRSIDEFSSVIMLNNRETFCEVGCQ